MQVQPSLPPLDVLHHVVDVHCHPTDSDVTTQAMDNLAITICAMSSRPSDQLLVRDLAYSHPEKVVPCFGQQLHAVQLAFSTNHASKLGYINGARLSSLVLALDIDGARRHERGALSATFLASRQTSGDVREITPSPPGSNPTRGHPRRITKKLFLLSTGHAGRGRARPRCSSPHRVRCHTAGVN